jgi:hypothetical protein
MLGRCGSADGMGGPAKATFSPQIGPLREERRKWLLPSPQLLDSVSAKRPARDTGQDRHLSLLSVRKLPSSEPGERGLRASEMATSP